MHKAGRIDTTQMKDIGMPKGKDYCPLTATTLPSLPLPKHSQTRDQLCWALGQHSKVSALKNKMLRLKRYTSSSVDEEREQALSKQSVQLHH